MGNLEQSALADLEFHRILAQLTRNALFLIVLDALREALLDLRREAISLPGNLEKGIQAHARILDAVAARDAGRARYEMVEHLAIRNASSSVPVVPQRIRRPRLPFRSPWAPTAR